MPYIAGGVKGGLLDRVGRVCQAEHHKDCMCFVFLDLGLHITYCVHEDARFRGHEEVSVLEDHADGRQHRGVSSILSDSDASQLADWQGPME